MKKILVFIFAIGIVLGLEACKKDTDNNGTTDNKGTTTNVSQTSIAIDALLGEWYQSPTHWCDIQRSEAGIVKITKESNNSINMQFVRPDGTSSGYQVEITKTGDNTYKGTLPTYKFQDNDGFDRSCSGYITISTSNNNTVIAGFTATYIRTDIVGTQECNASTTLTKAGSGSCSYTKTYAAGFPGIYVGSANGNGLGTDCAQATVIDNGNSNYKINIVGSFGVQGVESISLHGVYNGSSIQVTSVDGIEGASGTVGLIGNTLTVAINGGYSFTGTDQ